MSTELRSVRRSSTVPARGEIKALTGLRAVAATWVVLYHFQSQLWPMTDQVPGLTPVINAGWTGVELFFVLSGFVIARSYLDECGSRWSTRGAARFLFNRFARVWPAYAVVTLLAASCIAAAQLAGLRTDVVGPHPRLDVWELVQQLTMTQMWDRDTLVGSSWLTPGWSISAEWLAYIFFPVLALLIRPLRRLHPTVTLSLAVAVMAPLFLRSFQEGPHDTATSWVLRIAGGFVAGILVSMVASRLEEGERRESWGLFFALVSVVSIAAVCLWNTWRRAADPAVDYAGVVTVVYPFLVLGLALTRRGPARLLAKGPLVYGGRISYCLYLTHYVVKEVALTVVWQRPDQIGVLTPGLVLTVPALLLLSGVLAAALHHGVEEPARRLLVGWWKRYAGEAASRPERGREPGVAVIRAVEPAERMLPRVPREPRTERLVMGDRAVQAVPVRRVSGDTVGEPWTRAMTVVPREPAGRGRHGSAAVPVGRRS